MGSWRSIRLGDFLTLKRGYDLPVAQRAENGNVPIVSSAGIIGFHNEAMVAPPGVVTGRYGTVGTFFYINEPFWPLNTTLYVQDFKGNNELFAYYLLQTLDFKRYSDKTSVPGVNRNDLHRIKLQCPPLPEQHKIAAILSTWDESISKTQRLIASLQERKKGLMQRLLTGEVRFPGFENEWENHKLGDLLKPIARREKVDPHRIYSLIGVRWYVAGAHIHQTVPGNQIATSELSRIHENDILYNKMWVTKNAFGIARKEHHSSYGSTEYPQFVPKPNKIDVNFLGFFFHNPRFQYDAHRLCKGTTGRARLNPGDFLEIEVMIPKLEEQIKIAELLGCCEKEIELFSRRLDALKQQKKGLMQRLLTGQVRVKV